MSASESSFVLASASPRRRELLAHVGLQPRIRPAGVDESCRPGERPEQYAIRVAADKARAVGGEQPVLAADTVVALNGRSLGKPESPFDAKAMLSELSGREHQVHTAVVLIANGECFEVLVTTSVRFRTLPTEEIEAYVATGEPMDKAGSYGIQGLGGALTAEIRGSYTNVVGLPLEETLSLLERAGLR